MSYKPKELNVYFVIFVVKYSLTWVSKEMPNIYKKDRPA